MFDCIIIGAGPAGLTAAIYLRRNNKTVVLIDQGPPGGQMVNTAVIENYPGFAKIAGFDLAMNMFEQAKNLGAEFINREVLKITKSDDIFNVYLIDQEIKGRTVLYATGMKHKQLNIPSENKFINRGLSWCAICDGFLYKNKNVAVVGGGNSALEESLYLANLAKEVHLIHRRDSFRGESSLVDQVKEKNNISLHLQDEVIELLGSNKLETIILKSGQRLQVDCLFEYIGFIPNTVLLNDFSVLNEQGFVVVNSQYQTTVDGLYGAGDVIAKDIRQITTAVNDGSIAAMAILRRS